MMPSFTREALYVLVWSEPVSKIAPTLGVSDVAVAKACKKVHIPIPPRGYWRQERSGKAPKPEPLPPRGPGASGFVHIGADDKETDPADPADPAHSGVCGVAGVDGGASPETSRPGDSSERHREA